MTTTTSHPTKQVEKAAVNKAKQAAANPWVERLERLGYVVRGVIYIIIGVLAFQLAIGAGGATATPTSAIALIGRQPQGKFLLFIVALGLAGYSLWGLVRAILDPLRRGSDTKGLIERAGFLGSGVTYGLLLIPTVATLLNKPRPATAGATPGMLATLTNGPYGKWLYVAFGLFWVAVGIGQLLVAYHARFTRDLNRSKMSASEIEAAIWLGKLGYAARGVIFGLIGVIIIRTTLTAGAKQTPGFDAALAALAHAQYGELLLGAVAIGLILFGAYSVLCAKWNKLYTGRPA